MSTAPLNYSTESRGVLRRRVLLHRVLPAILLVLLAAGAVWLTPKVWRHQQLLAMQDELRDGKSRRVAKTTSARVVLETQVDGRWWLDQSEAGNVALVRAASAERLVSVDAIQQPPLHAGSSALLFFLYRVAEPASLMRSPKPLFAAAPSLPVPAEWAGSRLLTGSLEPVPTTSSRLQMDVLSVPATATTIERADRLRFYFAIDANKRLSVEASRPDVVDVTLTIPAPGEVVPLPPLPQPKP